MTPRGEKFSEESAVELSKIDHCMLICGHYEGLDERIMPLIDKEISLGDFVLTGGEIACMAVIDAVCRLVPGVLSTNESFEEESFYSNLLEYPQYTRPEVFMDMKVPDVLLSGHHRKIDEWRRYESLKLTLERRPDLLDKAELNKKDKEMLKKLLMKIINNIVIKKVLCYNRPCVSTGVPLHATCMNV
jgi:tRNA (guanine37-N1)-methyltransferase